MSTSTIGRFAPTPSGRLHLGNIFTAMLAWLSAKKDNGRCLLRIEDLDAQRCPRANADRLIDDLHWFGFTFDGEILFQSERADAYAQAVARLEKAADVYPCFCSRGQLHATDAPHADDGQPIYDGRCRGLSPDARPDRPACLRLAVPDENIRLNDGVQGEYRQNLARDCGDFILRRSDGVYAYQLAVVVDDIRQGVTEVVRGRDLLSSAPRQTYLYRLLGASPPTYYHVPLLLDADGQRMSKRSGNSNLNDLRRRFFSPDELIGMLAYNAGILPVFRPATLSSLLPLFDWNTVKKSDVRLNACGLF